MNGLGRRWRLAKLTGLAIAASAVLLAGLLALALVSDRVPKETLWRSRLALLVGLEIAYGLTFSATLLATPALGVLLVRARRRGRARPGLARWYLLGVSLLGALLMAEAVASLWRSRLERSGVLAIRRPDSVARAGADRPIAFPGPASALPLRREFPEPPAGEISLVVVGESSAEGVPFNLFGLSLGSLLAWQIEQALPGHRVHLQQLAGSGETLERQQRKLATLERRPDAVIIYCGHNEFSSRIPWGRELDYYVDGREPSSWDKFVAWAERTSPFCRLTSQAADTCRIAIPPPRGGFRVLVDTPAYTPAEYEALLADFRRRLDQIVAYTVELGAIPVLIIPPGNDSGLEPNRSFLPVGTRKAERLVFAREFRRLRRLESSDPDRARLGYESLLKQQPGFAEAHYRLARLLEKNEAFGAAYRHDVLARDLDGLPMRCPGPFHDAYRQVAARYPAILIDGQAYFQAISRRGLLDDELFMDAMHPSLGGQIALAQAVLDALKARGAFGWPAGRPVAVLEPAAVAAHYGIGPKAWEKLCLWGAMVFDLLSSGPHDPSTRLARRQAY